MPFPSPLAYSFCYAIRLDDGLVLLDLGWDSDAAWDALQRGLARAGATIGDVIGVVCTHLHPDHYGLARRIKTETSAWIASHPAEQPLVVDSDDLRALRATEIIEWLDLCGVPRSVRPDLEHEALQRLALPSVMPDRELVDRASVPGSAGRLVAWHTPGHTPGSLCLKDREGGLLFTGDHLLPRVTPNVSKRPRNGVDPLKDYLASLDVIDNLVPTLILPGHEWPFDRSAERTETLREHHSRRLAEIADAVEAGATTVWEVAQAVTWSRPFASFDLRAQRQALGEAHSHLQRLSASGAVKMNTEIPNRWLLGSGDVVAWTR